MTKTTWFPEPLKDLATTACELRSPEVDCDARIVVVPDIKFVVHPDGMMTTAKLRSSHENGDALVYSLNPYPKHIRWDDIKEEGLEMRWLTLAARAYRQSRPVLDPYEHVVIVPTSILDRAENGPPETGLTSAKFSVYLLGPITHEEIARRLPAKRNW